MGENKACFFCGTPFHIFNSVLILQNKKLKADIYIDDVFSTAKQIAANLIAIDMFENVYLIDRNKDWGFPNNKISQYIYALKGYGQFNKLVPKVIRDISQYSDYFFANDPRTDVFGRFIKFYIVKNCSNYNIHYYDDGLGSYNEHMDDITKIDYYARKLFFGRDLLLFNCDYYLTSPDFFRQVNPNSDKTIIPIGGINSEVNKLLKRVFYIDKTNTTVSKNVFFDTVRNEEFDKSGNIIFSRIIDKVLRTGKFMIKSHPREIKAKYDGNQSIEFGLPFEMLCLYNDFSDKVFINSFSTVVFSPKIIFNQEPKVVFLYKMMKKHMKVNDSIYDKCIEALKSIYSQKDKIIVCESEDALNEILNKCAI